MFPMVTIPENVYSKEPSTPRLHRKSGSASQSDMSASHENSIGNAPESFTEAFLRASTRQDFDQLPTPLPSVTNSMTEKDDGNEKEKELHFMDFIDIPSLVSDNEDELSDTESSNSLRDPARQLGGHHVKLPPVLVAAEQVKRSLKEEKTEQESSLTSEANSSSSLSNNATQNVESAVEQTEMLQNTESNAPAETGLSEAQFKLERAQLMKIAVKYVTMKIQNSFPPESARKIDPTEMPLEKFLLILVSRLQLTLPLFMKGIIYLFRYMDIIYLLRYLNQSNNFLNYTEMGYNLKKLIVGCFKLALARERINKEWSRVTGLANSDINEIVKTIVKRLNGKLAIKQIEIVRLKSEVFRFVKMVVKEV